MKIFYLVNNINLGVYLFHLKIFSKMGKNEVYQKILDFFAIFPTQFHFSSKYIIINLFFTLSDICKCH